MKYFLAFFSILFLLIYLFLKYDGYLGKGDYFIYYSGYDVIKSKKNKNIYLSDIRSYEYGNNYIIALRIPVEHYYCPNYNAFTISEKKLQYVIIDKKNDNIYLTYNKNNFFNMKEKLNINLKIKPSDEVRILKKSRTSIYDNETRNIKRIKECKKENIFPVIKY